MFERFNNCTVEMVKLGDYDDYENTYTQITLGTIEGDLQSYGGTLAAEDYGLKTECQFQFFCQADLTLDMRITLGSLVRLGDMTNTEIEAGRYLKISGKAYKIIYVADFGRGYEILLKGVELNGRRE